MTYKPDTYDIRNSPAQKIIDLLKADGYQVTAYDPMVASHQYSSIKEIAKGADALVVLVEHKVIQDEMAQKEGEIKKAMRHPMILRFYYEESASG
jgi:UDP-N-acetyl-D-mannosaminuronic acid dehydrogenase